MHRRIVSVIVSLSLITGAAVAVINHQWLRDDYVVHFSEQQPVATALSSSLSLTKAAEFIYRASEPQVQDAAAFNSSCRGVTREQTIVLGCYTQQHIYIYNVTDTRLNGVQQVTAAHELLHAVYQRMPSGERSRIDELLIAQSKTITDQRLKDLFNEYERTEPGQVVNELHSILGTEVTSLSPELEAHYKKYFVDRSKIVSYSQQYEQTFNSITQQINDYDNQLANLKNQKDDLEASLQTQQADLESEKTQLYTLRAQNDISGYNALVPTYNEKIRTYNSGVTRLQDIISSYNDIVNKRNALATTQNDLTKQLDSNYHSLQQ